MSPIQPRQHSLDCCAGTRPQGRKVSDGIISDTKIGRVTGDQRMFDLPYSLRKEPGRQDLEHFAPETGVFRGGCEEFLARSLVERDGMKLDGGHIPPARQDSACQHVGREFFPNKRLHASGGYEVLLEFCERKRKVGEGSDEMCAASGGRTLTEQGRRLPEILHPRDAFSSEIVRANEQRIIVQCLRAGRFVVRIIQADKSVAEK